MSASHSSKGPSISELLRWSDEPIQPFPHTPARPQVKGGISSILHGAALTPEEAEALQKRKQNSDFKKREMSGSGIFSNDEDLDSDGSDKPMVRTHQPAGGMSQILFGEEGSISPKKPTALHEVAKQRELSGNLEMVAEDTPSRKPTSTSKVRELVGSDIFGPPPEVQPRLHNYNLDPADANTSKTAGPTLASFGEDDLDLLVKKSNSYKSAELSGNNIFNEDVAVALSEKSLSAAKRREMTGSDIFADEKPAIREHLGGIRKPPGGGSSLTLV